MGTLVHVPDASLSIQIPASGLGQVVDDETNVWALVIHVGDQMKLLTLGFCLV